MQSEKPAEGVLLVGEPRAVETPTFDLSASQIEVFAGPSGCQAKWGFQYISRLPRRESASAQKGTALHKIQERYLKEGLYPADHNDPLSRLAMAGWQHLPPRETVDSRFVEGSFRLARDGVVWRGQIDLLHVSRGRVWVIDHKTTGSPKYALTPGTIRENVQAMLYAWVAGELSGLREIDLRWIYYDTRSENRTWVTDARVSTEEASTFLEKKIDAPAKRAIQLLRERPDPQTLPKNPAACRAYGGCPYAGVPCRLDTSGALTALFGLPATPQIGSHMQAPPPGFPPPPPGFPPPPPPPGVAPMATPSQTALGDLLSRVQAAPPAPPLVPPTADLATALSAVAPPMPPPPPAPAHIVSPPPENTPAPIPPQTPTAEPPRGTWFRDDYGRDVYGCLHCPAWLLPEQVFANDKAGACPSCNSRVNQFDGGYQAIAQRFNPPPVAAPPPMPPPPPALAAPEPPPPALPPPPPPALAAPVPSAEEPKKRGRPKGSKNAPKADAAPRVSGPTEIGTLYIGCMPDDESAVSIFDFVSACEGLIRTKPEHAALEDWRDIDYGKGAAVLAIAARHVQFGACDLYVPDARDPAFVALRGVLESFAGRIVRATV